MTRDTDLDHDRTDCIPSPTSPSASNLPAHLQELTERPRWIRLYPKPGSGHDR